MSTTLSEYETNRARNIERNNARLRALGLISSREESESNAVAWKISLPEDANNEKENGKEDGDEEYIDEEEEDEQATSSPRKRKKVGSSPVEASRKSRRLLGLTAEGLPSIPQRQEDREERAKECREARQAAALRFYEQEQNQDTKKAARENPTATYEHCLMRVQTMTDKRLANRVKAIERAAGKHCVVKMAVFRSCLLDEGKWELAELASAALERLKAMQPPPRDD